MKKFKKFYIEITSVCNLACSFCPPTERTARFITIQDFIKTLDQIKPHAEYIYFHVKGEPLLHPKISELLDISYDRGFKVTITTNGTLIAKNKHKLLRKPALRQINFSLHSFDGNEHNLTSKIEYIHDILSFAREAVTSTNLIISYRLWNLNQHNQSQQNGEKNSEILSIIEREYDLNYKIEEKAVPGKGIKLAERIYLNQDTEFQWPSLSADEDFNPGFCHGLRNQAGVLVDGTVIPCCLDGEGVINLGNIHEESFSSIIEGDRANKIYDGFSRREVVEELCRKCGYRKRFS